MSLNIDDLLAEPSRAEMRARRASLDRLSAHAHPTYVVTPGTKSKGWITPLSELRQDEGLDKAQLIASTIMGTNDHTVMLDLDVPAHLIPSSTPGNGHLYIDVPMSWRKYKRLLRALMKAGVIQRGYYDASIKRKHTSLRLPWITKSEDDGLAGSA